MADQESAIRAAKRVMLAGIKAEIVKPWIDFERMKAAEAEREACAQLIERVMSSRYRFEDLAMLADAIRARDVIKCAPEPTS